MREPMLGGRSTCDRDAPWNRELTAKLILIPLTLTAELIALQEIYLGAFGSHIDEHFFAEAKDVAGSQLDPDAFLRAVKKAIVAKLLMLERGIKLSDRHRSSDSGVRISPLDPAGPRAPFVRYLQLAHDLYGLSFSELHVDGITDSLARFALEDTDRVDAVTYLRDLVASDARMGKVKYRSFVSEHFTTLGNSAQRRALSAANQIATACGS
jgi:hypothetical protein